jgi:hypothetical protein
VAGRQPGKEEQQQQGEAAQAAVLPHGSALSDKPQHKTFFFDLLLPVNDWLVDWLMATSALRAWYLYASYAVRTAMAREIGERCLEAMHWYRTLLSQKRG